MSKRIDKAHSPISPHEPRISLLEQKSTSHNSKPSKGSNHSNTSSQEKGDTPRRAEPMQLLQVSIEPKAECTESKQTAVRIDLSQSSQSAHIDCIILLYALLVSKLNSKAYSKLISRLFKYLKKVLSNEIYTDIKRHFCEEAYRYINSMTYCFFRNDESQSSIFNSLKCEEMLKKGSKEKALKLSCDFTGKEKPVKIDARISQGEVPSSCLTNNDLTTSIKAEKKGALTPTNTRLIVAYECLHGKANSNSKPTKQSLYHLTKGRVNTPTIMKNAKERAKAASSNVNCFNKSKTQSNSKSSSRECSQKANHNHAKAKKSGISKEKLSHCHLHYEKAGISACPAKSTVSPIKRSDMIQSVLKMRMEKEAQCANTNEKNNKVTPCKELSAEIAKNSNDLSSKAINYKTLNKSSGPIIRHTHSKEKDKPKPIQTQYIDLAKPKEEAHSLPKSDEMLKVIKMSLDDNLKCIFNFSYEHFLSKESESQSKQSQDLNEPSS